MKFQEIFKNSFPQPHLKKIQEVIYQYFIQKGQMVEMRECLNCHKKLDNTNSTCDICGVWIHWFCGKTIKSNNDIPEVVRCFPCFEQRNLNF